MAANVYGKGVIASEQSHGRVNAETFFSFVCEHFANHLRELYTEWSNNIIIIISNKAFK